jgi:hypothetical protein
LFPLWGSCGVNGVHKIKLKGIGEHKNKDPGLLTDIPNVSLTQSRITCIQEKEVLSVSSGENHHVWLANYILHSLCLGPTSLGELHSSVYVNLLGPRGEVNLTALGVDGGGIDDACSDLVGERRNGAVRSADVGNGIG